MWQGEDGKWYSWEFRGTADGNEDSYQGKRAWGLKLIEGMNVEKAKFLRYVQEG